jgi:hypothetical protein
MRRERQRPFPIGALRQDFEMIGLRSKLRQSALACVEMAAGAEQPSRVQTTWVARFRIGQALGIPVRAA